MPKKRCKLEEIVSKLRQVDVLVSQDNGVADAIRQIGISEVYPLQVAPKDQRAEACAPPRGPWLRARG